ncbi:hypothetical protein NQ317_007905 [Molorchus minor]|uniref:PNK FHA domain-containing protein n=1 Tax=Molorchus minor TaxID=1323400 RepID=A0ABQ9JS73_9CUCU|nr:hypothetical protein NQ317_007905 [Molorchus minor]
MGTARVCYLQKTGSDKKISLPHGETITIGRSRDTEIQDLLISKQQIECTADIENCKIILKPIGKATSGIDGFDESTQVAKKKKMDFSIFNTTKQDDKGTVSSKGSWSTMDNKEVLIYTSEDCKGSSKIAAFDLDGTLTKTKSGARFPKDSNDWELNFGSLLQQLKKAHEEKFKILSLPIQVFVAIGRSIYRKPALGMWNALKELNDNLPVDLTTSFYVGDAAGREKNWAPKKNKDHSLADRLFALNIGVKFYTPEEYFTKSKPVPYVMPEFDPRALPTAQYPQINYTRPNVILMVGGPGSGKSHFCKKVIVPMGYAHINRDTLGSWQKCVKVLKEALQSEQSCVIDNTNPDKESRARYIAVAKEMRVKCYCFVMDVSLLHMKHNNRFRELTDSTHVPVSEIIINGYKKGYQEPDLSEGFEEIVKIPFVAEFERSDHEKLYKMFLLEK